MSRAHIDEADTRKNAPCARASFGVFAETEQHVGQFTDATTARSGRVPKYAPREARGETAGRGLNHRRIRTPMARFPSIDAVAELSREDWQDLAMGICAELFSAHRVEDRYGKGNGLDAWRIEQGALEGWQFRRFNARLGQAQVDEIKADVSRAAARARSEHRVSLRKFTIVFNIDPEPGHVGKKGEVERLDDLSSWATETHGTAFQFLGVTWVRTQLLKNPFLRPDLFEDVSGAIDALRTESRREFGGLHHRLTELANSDEVRSRLDGAIALLLREAAVHFERGETLHKGEEHARAVQSLRDASRLAEGTRDTSLIGRILALLAGVEALVGYLTESIAHGRRAVLLLQQTEPEYLTLAQGNLAFSLSLAQ
ncbi:MAG: hypothetical protein Q8P41_07055 [Pseudomonadota bacterium]|nr:hypothetical protein [Pseudomonadota bacterium]